jgi:metal-sulfur cluster biosynthetic enzyme
MLSEASILDLLRDCIEPATKQNIVDLGLVHGIETGPDPASTPAASRQWVKVRMTLTTPESPASVSILKQLQDRLGRIAAISRVELDLIWQPKWTPHCAD